MKLVIARHGKAEPDSPTGRDADRRLTPLGEQQALWLGRRLLAQGFGEGVILSSHAERARRTAEIIGDVLGLEAHLTPGLMIGRCASEALGVIQANHGHERLVLVGHNPTVSELAGILTHGLGCSHVGLRTGSAAIVELKGEPLPGIASLEEIIRLGDEGDEPA